MTEKIKEIVDQFLRDSKEYQSSYKYRLDHSYYVKFQNVIRTDCIRVILGIELPGYERQTSDVYKFSYGPLNDDNEGLAALILMQYKEAEDMNKDSVSVGYNLYKSVLIDNDALREKIKQLEKEIETWKQASIENHKSYLSEKMAHTKTEARIVFAKHILSGDRDEKVMEYCDKNEF